MTKWTVCVLLAGLLAACGADDDDASSTTIATDASTVPASTAPAPASTTGPAPTQDDASTDTTAPGSAAPTSSIELGDSEVERIVADLVDAGLCTDPHVPAEDPDELDIGLAPPEIEIECTNADGNTVNVAQMASDDALRALAIIAKGFYDAFGIDPAEVMVITPGNGIIVGVEASVEDAEDPAADAAWIDQASDVVDGDVVSMAELAEG